MELQELQKQLDEKKYFESQIAKQDLSGKMFYCEDCIFRHYADCQLIQESRVVNCVCARQENRRNGSENKASGTSSIRCTTKKSKSKK